MNREITTVIKQATIRNLTVFAEAELEFCNNLNVIIGENGTGKTHLLKMLYSVLAVSFDAKKKSHSPLPTKSMYQLQLAEKLVNVFKSESLGRVVRRKQGRERCDIQLDFLNSAFDIAFDFATQSKSEVNIEKMPEQWSDIAPAYLPTRELLTIYPNFVAVYEGHYLEFEETWRDTCLLLGGLLQKGPKEKKIRTLLAPLEEAMNGQIELDKNGRFYLKNSSGRIEMPLVAEGYRKLGMLARLIATGALLEKGYLFWDEPEANLNPRIIKAVAKSIIDLSVSGIQVFIATHSLFLLRELDILLSDTGYGNIDVRFFGLHDSSEGVKVLQGSSVDEIGDIASLDESLAQSERFLELGGDDDSM
jgi:AAA15 family ATPase/GTPase|nr:AAA family ATPase [Chlorobaculum thiosulfatiphilum]